jgi:heme A synthase
MEDDRQIRQLNLDFHRYAVLVVFSALVAIAIGAYITSQASGSQPPTRGLLNAVIHRDAALGLIVLATGLAIWLSLAQEGPFLGWTALCFVLLDGWIGWLGAPVFHASLAPLVFAMLVAIAVLSSSGWSDAPELVDRHAAPFLRPLAIAAPPLVLLQTALGAAYRHKLTGVTLHLVGAMLVAIATLVAATLVFQHYPEHRPLRSAATWLISIVLAQVILGATAFAMQLLDVKNAIAVIVATASHVVVGSLTLAATLVFSMQVQRSVRNLHLTL